MASGFAENEPGPARIVDEQVVAIFDPSDGRVLHLHTVRVFEGGQPVSADEAVTDAIEAARRHGHDVDAAETLHVAQSLGPGMHRVDLKTRTLAPIDLPPGGLGSR